MPLCYRYFTGHDLVDSEYSCADDCGSCSGARCEYCREVFVIEHEDGTDECYYDEEDARANGWYDWDD